MMAVIIISIRNPNRFDGVTYAVLAGMRLEQGETVGHGELQRLNDNSVTVDGFQEAIRGGAEVIQVFA